MLSSFRGKITFSGVAVLLVGIALLIFTFVSAYGFLSESLSIIATEDLLKTFGEALAPLIATCIRIMYLGVMGWIGSLITIRGVTIITHVPPVPTVVPQPSVTTTKLLTQPQTQKPIVEKPKVEKPKEEKEPPKETKQREEVKPPEPQFVVIPPAEISQPPPTAPPALPLRQKEQEQSDSTQQQSSST